MFAFGRAQECAGTHPVLSASRAVSCWSTSSIFIRMEKFTRGRHYAELLKPRCSACDEVKSPSLNTGKNKLLVSQYSHCSHLSQIEVSAACAVCVYSFKITLYSGIMESYVADEEKAAGVFVH